MDTYAIMNDELLPFSYNQLNVAGWELTDVDSFYHILTYSRILSKGYKRHMTRGFILFQTEKLYIPSKRRTA
jgi:hypothetical protein